MSVRASEVNVSPTVPILARERSVTATDQVGYFCDDRYATTETLLKETSFRPRSDAASVFFFAPRVLRFFPTPKLM